jgi:competence protein ComEA
VDQTLLRLEERFGLTRADLLGLVIALVGCVVATAVALRVPLFAADLPAAVASPSPGEPAAEPVGGPLVVHVAGAVAAPGIVELRHGDRVADALAAAGGPLADAVVDGLNLARPLVDGEQVLVPTAGDTTAAPPPGGDAAGQDGADVVLPDGRLDLNRATTSDLEELPGVGPVLASRILAYRDEHGPFTDPVELREVSGIGEATWASLRDLVGVR